MVVDARIPRVAKKEAGDGPFEGINGLTVQ
jgi:hypothetical protein